MTIKRKRSYPGDEIVVKEVNPPAVEESVDTETFAEVTKEFTETNENTVENLLQEPEVTLEPEAKTESNFEVTKKPQPPRKVKVLKLTNIESTVRPRNTPRFS